MHHHSIETTRRARRAPRRSPRNLRRPRHGSILVGAVLLMAIAGIAVVSWLLFINDSQRLAQRSRAQVFAFYAAEAGVERVVDFFNNAENYTGEEPREYDQQALHPANYPLRYPVYPDFYPLFEPYILDYAKNGDDLPVNSKFEVIWDVDANRLKDGEKPVVTRFTFFQNRTGTHADVSRTSKIPTAELDITNDETLVLRDSNDRETGRVVSLSMINPADLDADELAAVTTTGPVIAKVVSVGESRGVRVTVEFYLTEQQTPFFQSPAAIISEAAVEFSGNFNVAWGEVWARDNVDLGNDILGKLPALDRTKDTYIPQKGNSRAKDPWFRFRTEGVFKQGDKFADGRIFAGFANNPINKLDNPDVYVTPYHQDYLGRNTRDRINGTFVGLDNLKQNTDLEFPHYDYHQWKQTFLEFDMPYYWTDVSGNIYGRERNPASANYGQIVKKSYHDWFHISPSDPNYNDSASQYAFIDSVPTDANGNPAPMVNGVPLINETYYPKPKGDPAARIAEIKVAGQGTHTRGVILCNNNLNLTGQGNPPSWKDLKDSEGNNLVLMPDGKVPPEDFKIFHNGFMFSWGEITGGGNRTFYGSVYAVGGYGSAGTPSVYYNVRMKDGSWIGFRQSRVRRSLWNVHKSGSADSDKES